MDLGDKISECRRELQLRQRDLAEQCDITQEAVSQIERSRINPTVPTIFRIACCMGLTVSELFEGVTGAAGIEEVG